MKPAAKIAWISAIGFAGVCFALGFVLAFVVTPVTGSNSWRNNIVDFGSAIGGLWALSAGLLAYSATIWGVNRQEEMRFREVATVCLAEVESIWLHLEELKVIDSLNESTLNVSNDRSPGRSYRINVGESWLTLQSGNPEAFGVLPHPVAQELTSYYSRLRDVIGKLNWMNSQNFDDKRLNEVIGRQKNVEKDLRALRDKKADLISTLKVHAGVSSNAR